MKTRVLTALVAIPVVLAVVGCTNPWPLAVLLGLVAFQCGREIDAMLGFPASRISIASIVDYLFFAIIVVMFSGQAELVGATPVAVIGFLCLASLGVASGVLIVRSEKSTLVRASVLSLWCVAPLLSLLYQHASTSSGGWSWLLPNPILMVLLPVWAGDTFAMLGGKFFGKHLMAPKISPKKTWEGAVANFVASVLAGWGVGAWLGYEPWVGLACGAAVGVFGQLGDLFESALKRAAGKKDSGTLLPGHGGVLDRIDALLASVIPVWLILHFSGAIGS